MQLVSLQPRMCWRYMGKLTIFLFLQRRPSIDYPFNIQTTLHTSFINYFFLGNFSILLWNCWGWGVKKNENFHLPQSFNIAMQASSGSVKNGENAKISIKEICCLHLFFFFKFFFLPSWVFTQLTTLFWLILRVWRGCVGGSRRRLVWC